MSLPAGISVHAVATWSQLSAETVCLVLRGAPRPCEATRRRVWCAIEELAQRQHDNHKRPRVRWANTVGFVFLITLMIIVTGHDILKLL